MVAGFASRQSWSRRSGSIPLSREFQKTVRFALAVILVALLAIAGLFVYGLTLQPEIRTIEQDAVGAGDA